MVMVKEITSDSDKFIYADPEYLDKYLDKWSKTENGYQYRE